MKFSCCLVKESAVSNCNDPEDPSGPEKFITSMPDKAQRKRKSPNELGRLMIRDAFCGKKALPCSLLVARLLATRLCSVLLQSMVSQMDKAARQMLAGVWACRSTIALHQYQPGCRP